MQKFKYLLILFILALIIFVASNLDIYSIDSRSMENTLLVGDRVIIKKFPRRGKSLRNGNTDIENLNGKILVFQNQEYQIDKYFIKRCIASPGDTLYCSQNETFINGVVQCFPFERKYLIYTSTTKENQLYDFAYSHDINITKFSSGNFNLLLTESMIDSLKFEGLIKKFSYIYKSNSDKKNCIYTPPGMVMPKKGDLNREKSGRKFGLCYEENEDKEFVQANYYFMMGDNRPISIDSRDWGIISEYQIVGKAILVLFSIDNRLKGFRKIRLTRIFKGIK